MNCIALLLASFFELKSTSLPSDVIRLKPVMGFLPSNMSLKFLVVLMEGMPLPAVRPISLAKSESSARILEKT